MRSLRRRGAGLEDEEAMGHVGLTLLQPQDGQVGTRWRRGRTKKTAVPILNGC